MGKLRMKLARMMYGRYGIDKIYHVLMLTAIVLMVVNFFVGSIWISIVELALLVWAMFRFFSKNIYKRQRENQAFTRFFGRIGSWFKLQKNRFCHRKTHVFRKCPFCKNQLRLPKQKGKHTVNCPCCHQKFETKI